MTLMNTIAIAISLVLYTSCTDQKSADRFPSSNLASTSCAKLLRLLSDQSSPIEFKELDQLINNQNKLFFSDTKYFEYKDDKFKKVLELTNNLTPDERKKIISKIDSLADHEFRNGKFISDNPRFMLKLVLQDVETWDTFIELMTKYIVYNAGELSKTLYPLINKFDDKFKLKLLKKIFSIYGDFEKKSTYWMGPKRFFDAIISYLNPPESYFKNQIKQMKVPPLDALNKYLDEINQLFGNQTTFGGYDAHDILAIAKEYQLLLKDNNFVVLTGSFPNGKARLRSSDIDLFISHDQYADNFLEIDKKINFYLRAKGHPNAKIETHSTPVTFNLHELAMINPIHVRVDKKQISLMVYPPITIWGSDVTLTAAKWPDPVVYILQ